MKNIEIFTGPDCAHCEIARALLTKHGLPFKDHDIGHLSVMDDFRRRLPRVRSIPQIFVDGEHLGNDEDLSLKLDMLNYHDKSKQAFASLRSKVSKPSVNES